MAAEKKSPRPMDSESTKLRGRVVDELQGRIQHLSAAGKQPPKLWHEKLAAITETDNASLVEETHEWMAKELPPKEYHTAAITWETYAMFGGELLDKLTLYGARQNLLGQPTELAAELILQIFQVRESVIDPVAALAELAKIRGRAVTELKRFQLEV